MNHLIAVAFLFGAILPQNVNANPYNPQCAKDIQRVCPDGQEDSCKKHASLYPRRCIAKAWNGSTSRACATDFAPVCADTEVDACLIDPSHVNGHRCVPRNWPSQAANVGAEVLSNPKTYFCTEFDRVTRKSKSHVAVLTQTEAGVLREDNIGKAFQLEWVVETDLGNNSLIWKKAGRVTLYDVSLRFVSNDNTTIFDIDLDELDQSKLTINGRDAGEYRCHKL